VKSLTKRNPYGVNVTFKIENNDIIILHPFLSSKFMPLTKLIETYVITQMEFDFFRKSVSELGYRLILKPTIEIKK
jgi:hypothetical protein